MKISLGNEKRKAIGFNGKKKNGNFSGLKAREIPNHV